jgi:hypothetical protein
MPHAVSAPTTTSSTFVAVFLAIIDGEFHMQLPSNKQQIANKTGLRISVAHYPTGASKWNPPDRRPAAAALPSWGFVGPGFILGEITTSDGSGLISKTQPAWRRR